MGRKWENEMGYEGLRRAKVKGKQLQELRCNLIFIEMKKKTFRRKGKMKIQSEFFNFDLRIRC